jgi:hypothetical protein
VPLPFELPPTALAPPLLVPDPPTLLPELLPPTLVALPDVWVVVEVPLRSTPTSSLQAATATARVRKETRALKCMKLPWLTSVEETFRPASSRARPSKRHDRFIDHGLAESPRDPLASSALCGALPDTT